MAIRIIVATLQVLAALLSLATLSMVAVDILLIYAIVTDDGTLFSAGHIAGIVLPWFSGITIGVALLTVVAWIVFFRLREMYIQKSLRGGSDDIKIVE